MPKTDAQEHRDAMKLRRVSGGFYRQETAEYIKQSMDIIICCSCGWPVDKWDRENINIGDYGVRCQTCQEKGKVDNA
jgi:hypothetical protein